MIYMEMFGNGAKTGLVHFLIIRQLILSVQAQARIEFSEVVPGIPLEHICNLRFAINILRVVVVATWAFV